MVQRQALPFPPRLLLLLLVALLPARSRPPPPQRRRNPLAAVAESPSLPRELLARVRASGAELAAAGLAPLAAAAVDARGGGDAPRGPSPRRARRCSPSAGPRRCSSGAPTTPRRAPTRPRPARHRRPPRGRRKNAALFHWLAVELDAALAVAPAAPASPTARREGGTRSLADELREARAVLAARLETFPSSSTSSTSSTSSSSSNSGFSCYPVGAGTSRGAWRRGTRSRFPSTNSWRRRRRGRTRSSTRADCDTRDSLFSRAENERNRAAAAAAGGNDSRDHLVDGLNLTAFGAVVETCRVGGRERADAARGPGRGDTAGGDETRDSVAPLRDGRVAATPNRDGRVYVPERRVAGARDGRRGRRPARRQTRDRHRARFLPRGSRRGRPRVRWRVRASRVVLHERVPTPSLFSTGSRRSSRSAGSGTRTAARGSGRGTRTGAPPDWRRGSTRWQPRWTRARVRLVAPTSKALSRRPLTRVDLDALAATIRRFRSADAAMFGCRRGAYAHSAAGGLADALDGYRAVLASCPTATADAFVPTSFDPTNFDPTGGLTPRSSTRRRRRRRGHPRDRSGGRGESGVDAWGSSRAAAPVSSGLCRRRASSPSAGSRFASRGTSKPGAIDPSAGRGERLDPTTTSGVHPERRPEFLEFLEFPAALRSRSPPGSSTGTFRRGASATSRSSRTWTACPEFPPNPRATIASARPRRRWATSWTCRARGTTDAATPSPSPPRGRPPRVCVTIWSSGVSRGASASRSPGTRRGTPPRTTACGARASSG